MKKFLITLLILMIAVGLIAIAEISGLISLNPGSKKAAYQNKGKLDVVCDLEVGKPGDSLAQPFETIRQTMPAQIDFDENTGWYTGEYTISMNRKGTLQVKDDLLMVSRPAMFKRHGLIIIGEHFTLNRRNGEFKQWLDLDGGKRLDLINGRCKRTNNASF